LRAAQWNANVLVVAAAVELANLARWTVAIFGAGGRTLCRAETPIKQARDCFSGLISGCCYDTTVAGCLWRGSRTSGERVTVEAKARKLRTAVVSTRAERDREKSSESIREIGKG